ncbi:MAG: hypothetical protein HOQ18_12680 [Dermatophilaceae bacterium]|nr:hypothetical protein [Dermatophilaceae bacterium]NUO91657.1 hypothetical protein [Dermatophilaceae bacterium]NUR80365.1 hypothetical protein [Dermatophilaceae bacterium]
MIPDFAGDIVIAVRHEYAVELWTERHWEFRLAGHTVLEVDGRPPQVIDNDTPPDPRDTDLIQGLVGQTFSSVVISPGGRLDISLAGARLSVDPDDHWESWELSGARGAKIVCVAGGELVTWPPMEEA